MSRIAYINGAYLPQSEAVTPIEDRGYQFADGIYEYIAFYNHRFLDWEGHIARLKASLLRLGIPMPMSENALKLVAYELMARNRRDDGGLYMQVTRGVARRDHPFPARAVKPVLSMTIGAAKIPKPQEISEGVGVITYPDERWAHCNVKSIALLANVLAKQAAALAKAREAWLVKPDGTVTECASANAFIVTKGVVVTHPADSHILPGITRNEVLKIARENGVSVLERPFTLTEAKQAEEAFLTSTSPNVLPVVRIDGEKIGSGVPGPVTKKLLSLYLGHLENQTGRRFA